VEQILALGRPQLVGHDAQAQLGSFVLPDASLSLQAHNDLLRTYEAKLLAFGIPLDNVGFKPLETAVVGQTLGQGPAGLVGTPT
jgi:hypothetical protein